MVLAGSVSSCKRRLQAMPPRAVLLIGYVVFLLWAFPGYMSSDSVNQLAEARSGHFSDGNPPLMAAEWYVLDRIVSGPFLMLLVQSMLFLGGVYFISRRLLSERAAAWTAIAILLFPPVMTPMAVIWKDSQMAAFLIAGIAAFIQPRRRTRWIGLALIAAGCIMRHNALAAGAPLIGLLFEGRAPLAWYKRLGIIVGAAVLALGALLGVGRLLASRHVRITPVFYDILGMVAYGDHSDEELRYILRDTPLAMHDHIQERALHTFELRGVGRVVYGDDRMFDYPTTDAQWDALYRSWKDLVTDDPGAYFASHWQVFELVLGVDERPRAPVYNLFVESEFQIDAAEHAAWPSDIQQYTGHALYWLADDTPMFKPYVYAILALLLLALFCRDRFTFALLASGLLYELSFLPPFAEPDYRYSHWMITMVVIATVTLVIQGAQKRRQRDASKAAA